VGLLRLELAHAVGKGDEDGPLQRAWREWAYVG